jgi:uncharacterized protein (DUF2141 family)
VAEILNEKVFCFVADIMNKPVLTLLAFCLCLYSFAQGGKAVVEIENIRVIKGGQMAIAGFTAKYFLKTGKQVTAVTRDVTSEKMIFTFENLPAGEYAFAAYQDVDRNKSLNTNIIGYPKEPFGFSNNPTILFGPPSFEDSKVTVTANKTTTVKIKLR